MLITLKSLILYINNMIGSFAWLFPNAKYWKDYVFISTPTRNYTANDIGGLLEQQSLHVSKHLSLAGRF